MTAAAAPATSAKRGRGTLQPRWLWVHAALVYLFLFAPILVLVIFSFNEARSGTRFTGFSTTWYSQLFDNEDIQRAFRNTLVLGLSATAVSTVIRTLAAFALTRSSSGGGRPTPPSSSSRW